MQSFASPTHTNPPPHKNHAPQIKHHKFMPHPHKKGATIAYTYALSTQKSTERAQISLIPTPFLPKKTIERAQLSLILTPFLPKKP